jgi:hypothetical protein
LAINKISLKKKHSLKLGLGKPLREEASKKGSQGFRVAISFLHHPPLKDPSHLEFRGRPPP